MSHDRGCFRCFEDGPYDRCADPKCPKRRDEMVNHVYDDQDSYKPERKVPRFPSEVTPPTKGDILAEGLKRALREGKAKKIDMKLESGKPSLMNDSGDKFLDYLHEIAEEDAEGLIKAQQSYGNSWKSRGGVGAYMMACRKSDRLDNRIKRKPANGGDAYDIFAHIASDERAEGVIDDIRDLRRYLLLIEAEMRARGFQATHRDNK